MPYGALELAQVVFPAEAVKECVLRLDVEGFGGLWLGHPRIIAPRRVRGAQPEAMPAR